MKQYKVEDFLCKSKPMKFQDEVEKKISILYDFCILRKCKKEPDVREELVRDLFLKCGSIDTVEGIIKDLQRELYTVNKLLKENNYDIV